MLENRLVFLQLKKVKYLYADFKNFINLKNFTS